MPECVLFKPEICEKWRSQEERVMCFTIDSVKGEECRAWDRRSEASSSRPDYLGLTVHIPHFQYLSGRLKVFFAGLENRKFIEKQLNHHMNSNNQVLPLTCICTFEAPLIFIYLLYCYSISSFIYRLFMSVFVYLLVVWLRSACCSSG